jgi:MFS family permease
MQNTALAWFVVELTHSPVAVGVLAFCRFVPFTLFGFFAGVVADRLDNRRFLLVTQSSMMAVAVALTALGFWDGARAWQVYVLAALAGTAQAFDNPVRSALTYQLVGPSGIANAVALNSSIMNSARVIGPAIAGGVIALIGVSWCFAVNAVSFIGVLVALLAMRADELLPVKRRAQATVLRSLQEGISYVRRDRRLGLLLLVVGLTSAFGFNFHVLLPVLVSQTLHDGPEVFGFLSAVFGVGALAGALAVATRGRASFGRVVLGVTVMGCALVALAFQRSAETAGLLLVVAGWSFTTWSSNANALIQLSAPDHLRGRLLSLYFFCFLGLQPLGSLLAGWLSDLGGTELAFLAGGVACIAVAASAVVIARSSRIALRADNAAVAVGDTVTTG